MRKMFVLALISLGAALALAACKPAPAMKEYTYPAWGFAVSFWAPPQVVEAPPGSGRPHMLMLESKQAGRVFALSAREGVRPGVDIDQIGPDLARQAAQAMGGELGVMSYTSTGQGVLGREFAITKDGKPLATVRSYLANGRFYEIAAQSVLGQDDPAVKDFLDSFQITAAPPAVPPPPGPANAAPTNTP
jgi:ABC-type amino acid transport substrate-binding protein